MRKYKFRKLKNRVVAFAMAAVLGLSFTLDSRVLAADDVTAGISGEASEDGAGENTADVTAVATDSDASEDDILEEVFSCDGEEIPRVRLYQGASREVFTADGTDGQMPDDEWAEVKARCDSMLGQTMDCITFVNKALGLASGMSSSSKAAEWLLANGYYEVVSRTDLTDGTNFTAGAEAAIAKIRRGDILVFSNDAGVCSHIGIAGVEDDGSIYIYEGGMYGTGFSNRVCKDTMAYYLSGCKSQGDGYADNMQVFRKDSQAGTAADEEYETTVSVRYNTHVQSIGWQRSQSNDKLWCSDGEMAGTSGRAKRLEGITIKVTGGASLGIRYTTHCQSYGWLPWVSNGEMSGTEGEAKRLEAIKIELTGADKDNYDVYYRVHAQSYGWLGWAKNGEAAGTSGLAKRLEAIQIVVVNKEEGDSFDENLGNITSKTTEAYISDAGTDVIVSGADDTSVAYRTHVQSYGWQGWKYNGTVSGTSGQAKRLEGIYIKLVNAQYPGGITYRTHVQSYGWEDTWRSDGELSGTTGEAKRLEAIQIELTGEMAEQYDVYYRVHAQSYGWLGWAKNGESAGTAGYSKRLEAIQVELVPKGSDAPGSTENCFISK